MGEHMQTAVCSKLSGRGDTLCLLLLPLDVLRLIGSLVVKEFLPCLRAACRTLRDLTSMPTCAQPRCTMLGSPELAAWAWDQRGFRSAAFPPWEQKKLCESAAGVGSVSTLAWLRLRGCEWDAYTCEAAAWGGHLDVLRWARTRGCDWNSGTTYFAALGGHLTVLQWAREHGCAWHSGTCLAAAQGGQLSVLQWAIANGCPWDHEECLHEAVYYRHPRVAEWVLALWLSELAQHNTRAHANAAADEAADVAGGDAERVPTPTPLGGRRALLPAATSTSAR